MSIGSKVVVPTHLSLLLISGILFIVIIFVVKTTKKPLTSPFTEQLTDRDASLLLHICALGPFDTSGKRRIEIAEDIWSNIQKQGIHYYDCIFIDPKSTCNASLN